jgi:hypothetical protein
LYFPHICFFVSTVLVCYFFVIVQHTTQTPMPPAGFEPAIPASARPLCATRSPYRPASSQSLRPLRYPGCRFHVWYTFWETAAHHTKTCNVTGQFQWLHTTEHHACCGFDNPPPRPPPPAHPIYALTCFVSPLLKTAYRVFLSTKEKGCSKENDSFALP